VNKRVIRWLAGQFHRPHGVGGHLAGWVMAHRCSNRRRNRWVVSLLDVQPAGRVLEIGFGPGIAIAELSWLATRGPGIRRRSFGGPGQPLDEETLPPSGQDGSISGWVQPRTCPTSASPWTRSWPSTR
jgi:hypothetical protein